MVYISGLCYAHKYVPIIWAIQAVQWCRISAAGRDSRDSGLISRLGGSPGRGNGNPLQYSCPETLKDRDSWQATVHRVTKSGT